MQSLCTLRVHCRQWPRNTYCQAGATPYLGRTFTGWIAPACGWRTHSITSSPLFAERNVMECRRDDDGLFRLDVGRPDHLAPFLGFPAMNFPKSAGEPDNPHRQGAP